MIYLTANHIIQMNQAVTGVVVDPERRQKVSSAFASVNYYDTIEERITCIVSAVIKNHYFLDGNKRTALFVYLVLCQLNSLKVNHTSSELANIMEAIAVSSYNIEKFTEILFKD